jgi:chorismate synthase
MNSFGRLFRISLYGESHGGEVGVIVDGCPAGIVLPLGDFAPDLERRKSGTPGTTSRREPDEPMIKSGVFKLRTSGSPILISFENRDIEPDDYIPLLDTPRPGHADFVARSKFGGFNDPRGGGHFSGRLSLALVSAGVIAKKLLSPTTVHAGLIEAGGSTEIDVAVQAARREGDSVGGIVECRIAGLPVGLGEPFFDTVESLISHIVFAIPGVKGIEFGSGFACAKMRGSQCNDALVNENGKTRSNHAGGINGGISNGNDVVFRVAVRPPSSITKEQDTISLRNNRPAKISVRGRHDACIALRMPVIVEAAAAIVTADLMLIEQKIPRIMEEENEPR